MSTRRSPSSSSDSSRRERRRRRHSTSSETSSLSESTGATPAGTPERNVGSNQVPPAPEDLKSEIAREKVNLSENEMSTFRNYARGTAVDTRLRDTFFFLWPNFFGL